MKTKTKTSTPNHLDYTSKDAKKELGKALELFEELGLDKHFRIVSQTNAEPYEVAIADGEMKRDFRSALIKSQSTRGFLEIEAGPTWTYEKHGNTLRNKRVMAVTLWLRLNKGKPCETFLHLNCRTYKQARKHFARCLKSMKKVMGLPVKLKRK